MKFKFCINGIGSGDFKTTLYQLCHMLLVIPLMQIYNAKQVRRKRNTKLKSWEKKITDNVRLEPILVLKEIKSFLKRPNSKCNRGRDTLRVTLQPAKGISLIDFFSLEIIDKSKFTHIQAIEGVIFQPKKAEEFDIFRHMVMALELRIRKKGCRIFLCG